MIRKKFKWFKKLDAMQHAMIQQRCISLGSGKMMMIHKAYLFCTYITSMDECGTGEKNFAGVSESLILINQHHQHHWLFSAKWMVIEILYHYYPFISSSACTSDVFILKQQIIMKWNPCVSSYKKWCYITLLIDEQCVVCLNFRNTSKTEKGKIVIHLLSHTPLHFLHVWLDIWEIIKLIDSSLILILFVLYHFLCPWKRLITYKDQRQKRIE